MMRENVSWPTTFVPNQCAAEGPGQHVAGSSTGISSGGYGAMSGAKMATTMNVSTKIAPTIALGLPLQPEPGLAPETAGRRLERELGGLELGDAHRLSLIRGLRNA